MAGRIEALLLMIAIPIGIVLALTVVSDKVLRRVKPVPVDSRFPALKGAWGITERSRLVGIALGAVVLVCGLLLMDQQHGLSLVLAPAAAALVCVLSLLVGQRMIGRSMTGEAAGLEVRTVRRYAPRAALVVLGLGILLVAVALIGGGWFGSYGRQFDSGGYDEATGLSCSFSYSPFFGPFYVIPMAGLLALLGACAAATLRATASRPRNGAEPSIVSVDDEVRCRAVTVVLGAAGCAVWSSLAIALTNFRSTANTLRTNGEMPGGCGPDMTTLPETLFGCSAPVALVVTLWCLARVIRPGAARPVDLDDLA